MNIPWEQLLLMAELGALGGVVQCVIRGIKLPYRDENTDTWHLGSIGNIFVGGVAAAVMWGLYGSFASFDVQNGKEFSPQVPGLQLAFSVLVGYSGAEVLKLEAQKRLFGRQKVEMSKARIDLVTMLRDVLSDQEGDRNDPQGQND